MKQIFLTADPSDLSGYLLASIGSRSPNATSTPSSSVTDAEDSGTAVPITVTGGGTALKWITPPLKNAVTIAGSIFASFWGKESNAAANCSLGFTLAEYTTSQQSVFCTAGHATELGTTDAVRTFTRIPADASAYTSTVIEAGNRLVIIPVLTNVGTMAASNTVTSYYNGSVNGALGDTYLILTEELLPTTTQQPAPGPIGSGYANELISKINALVASGLISGEAQANDIVNMLAYLRDGQGA